MCIRDRTGAAWPAAAPACVCRLHVVAVQPVVLVSDEKRIRGVICDDALYKLQPLPFLRETVWPESYELMIIMIIQEGPCIKRSSNYTQKISSSILAFSVQRIIICSFSELNYTHCFGKTPTAKLLDAKSTYSCRSKIKLAKVTFFWWLSD